MCNKSVETLVSWVKQGAKGRRYLNMGTKNLPNYKLILSAKNLIGWRYIIVEVDGMHRQFPVWCCTRVYR